MDVFELRPQPTPRKWRNGIGVVAYSDDGELFINSELIGLSAMTAFLCCSSDGTGFIASGDKVLVPLSWAMTEKPELKADLEKLAEMASDATAGS